MADHAQLSDDEMRNFVDATAHRAKVLMGVVKQITCCPHCAVPALAAALAAATKQAGDYTLDEVCELFRSLRTGNDALLDHIAEGVECIPVKLHKGDRPTKKSNPLH